ncbi:MAG: hypothetical protein DLM61_11065, partial [Pseudonocardiales bacterium]
LFSGLLAQSANANDELTDFRAQALARLAAQYDEITRLRDSAAAASRVTRLPERPPPSDHAADMHTNGCYRGRSNTAVTQHTPSPGWRT